MVSEFTLLGRLTRDPEVKYTAAGMAVAKVDVAVNSKIKEKDEVSFFSITVFGKTAENASQYLSKGKQVFAAGEIRQQTWTTPDGEKKSRYEFLARKIVFISGGSKNGSAGTKTESPDDFIPEIDDDDITI